MAITPTGSTSNIDVNGIVTQLMTAERAPLAEFTKQQAQVQARISALGSLKGGLAAFQNAAKTLDSLDRFRAWKADSSDKTILTASAGHGAAPGSHAIEVQTLAQAHRIKSGTAYAATTDAIGEGTLTFQFGSYDSGANSFALNPAKAAQSIVIAPGAGTVAGIRDAVNAANIGVTASIVNDGAGQRLVFSSKDSGLANSLKLTVVDGDGVHTDTAGLSALAYNPTAAEGSGRNMTQTAAALNASFTVDGVAISKSSNIVSDAIEGVTLNLLKAAPGTTMSLTVAQDTAGAKSSVQAFVKAYNDLAAQLKSLTSYNPATKQSGLLQGDSLALSLGNRLRGQITAAVTGAPATMATLSQVGVTVQKDGSLAFDGAKFDTAAAASLDDVAGVFTRLGRPSHAEHVIYEGASTATKAGSFAVNITQVATQGKLVGNATAGLTITAGVNDSVSLTVDGVQATVTLAAGSYADAAALAAELQTKANGAADFANAGVSIAVAAAGGTLTATSALYGGLSGVQVAAGAAGENLFGAAPVATGGLDVAGTINGAAAVGSGQMLTGAAGDACEGLSLRICALTTGACGTVTFSTGQAPQINLIADEFLATGGSLVSRLDSYGARVKDITRRQEAFSSRLDMIEQRYRSQYVALDALLTRMGSTSAFLTSQLANLPK